jgi:ribosomal protein L16 Arg81 hydroxylase
MNTAKLISEFLAPVALDQFLQEYWGRKFLHVPGHSGKFSHLFSWQRLNQILMTRSLDFPTIRMSKGGKLVPTDDFIDYRESRNAARVFDPHLKYAEINRQMNAGATLILTRTEQLDAQVMDLSFAFQQYFQERVRVSTFAAWKTEHGFDTHWDDHEAFVLQIAGRKKWELYGFNKQFPLGDDAKAHGNPPQVPIWEGILEEGDLLYMPRGCWHKALPDVEPTLHITVGVYNSHGLELMKYLSTQLRENIHFRQDLPRFASYTERTQHMQKLREELLSLWDDNLLEKFFTYQNGMAPLPPLMTLPLGGSPEMLPESGEVKVALHTSRPLTFIKDAQSGTFEFITNGKKFRLPEGLLPLLEKLQQESECTLKSLFEACPTFTPKAIRDLVAQLILAGMIRLIAASESEKSL